MPVPETLISRELGQLRRWWSGGHRTVVHAVVAVALIVVAYHYSLATLVRSVGLETPLAYLGLVPVMALGLAAIRARDTAGPPIHDRQLDYIVGVPFLISAVAVNLVLPARLSTFFWLWRLDLLSLPLFTAGVVCLVFGVRTLWKLRLAVAFLLLAWPLPYTVLLLKWLGSFTDLTLAGVKTVLRFVPVAHPAPSGDGSLFVVGRGPKEFTLSVVSACAGVNGFVGFLLVSVASLAVVRGPRRRKAAWLTMGLALIWALNVLRIVLIFAAGAQLGRHFAVDGLHPVIGLFTFNAGVVAMALLLRRFGLVMAVGEPAAAVRARRPETAVAVPRARSALAIVAIVAAFLATSNTGLRQFDLVASDLGAPRVAAFADRPQAPAGWRVFRTGNYDWAKRYFGEKSTWQRLTYVWKRGVASPLRSTAAITSDVITTTDLRTFSTYGLEACYRFHNYKLHDVRSVPLGAGVVGRAVSYYSPKLHSDWTTLYWHWPVATTTGTRYERVTLMLVNAADTHSALPRPSPGKTASLGVRIQNAISHDPSEPGVNRRLSESRSFLASFANVLISGRSAR